MNKIEVGVRVIMEVSGYRGKLQSYFVGYIKNRCVITMIPHVSESNRSIFRENLYKGNSVTVRFIHAGTVLGFITDILHVAFTPFPILFLQYPEDIESFNLRKDSRVPCLFPVSIGLNGTELSAAMADISKAGCNVNIQSEPEDTPSLNLDDIVSLRCPLLFGDPEVCISCEIKRLDISKERNSMGLKFNNPSEEVAQAITSYIEQTILFVRE